MRFAVLVDAMCVLAFCAIGRRSHGEDLSTAGLAQTAVPFLMGTAIAGLAAMVSGWKPTALRPTGVTIWLSTVVVGMVWRRVTSAGTAFSFVVVASVATAILILGWRVCWRLGAKALARR
jgi:hypothetical protein